MLPGKFYTVGRKLISRTYGLGGHRVGDCFSFVTTVYPKVALIDGDNRVPGIEFAHPNQADIGESGLMVCVSSRHRSATAL
jgi:hypothetical protein